VVRGKDLDFERRELTVRDGKGGRDRLTLLPQSLVAGLPPSGYAVQRTLCSVLNMWLSDP